MRTNMFKAMGQRMLTTDYSELMLKKLLWILYTHVSKTMKLQGTPYMSMSSLHMEKLSTRLCFFQHIKMCLRIL